MMAFSAPAPAAAQDVSQGNGLAPAAAAYIGVRLANEAGVGRYLLSGFLGGLATGLFLPVAVSEQDAPPTGGAILGVGLFAGTLARADLQPAPLVRPDQLSSLSAEDWRVVEASYHSTLKRRRQRAAMSGAALGTGAGLGILVFILTRITT